MIRGKNSYLVLSLIKKLLTYPNLSPKYVLFVKRFKPNQENLREARRKFLIWGWDQWGDGGASGFS